MHRISPILFLLFFVAFSSYSQKDSISGEKTKEELPPVIGEVFKPTIGFGVGMFSFFGDVYNKNYQAPWTSRLAYDLSISQKLNNSFRLNFYTLFGRLGANERIDDKRYVNFDSQIRLGGLNVMYSFDNFIKNKDINIRPWVSLGVEGFEFLSKTDQYDRYGNKYYYWSDGSIRNMDQNAPGAVQNAKEIVRDYTYESDIREMNLDGFGKYAERSWAIPVGFGALFKLGDRFEMKMGATFHYTFTDYIDGISNKSVGGRAGNKRNDCFVMTSFSLHYNLFSGSVNDTLPTEYFDDVDFVALNREDEDKDGVPDFEDKCHGTHPGAKVNADGCAVDSDEDAIPDHMDDEPNTPEGSPVNGRGITYTEEMGAKWYELYYDSTGTTVATVVIGNIFRNESNGELATGQKNTDLHKEYTVELKRFKGPVPDDEMMKLLSTGDVKSTASGEYTVYTVAGYKDINKAIEKQKQLDSSGVKDTKIGVFNNGEYTVLSDQEVKDEVAYSAGKEVKLNPSDTSNKSITVINPIKTNPSDTITKTNPNNPDLGSATHNQAIKGVIFRVQLGAYKRRISKSIFGKSAPNVIEIATDDGYYRYASGSYTNMQDVAAHRADMVLEGITDAFITAYKDGKRVPLREVGATFENKKDEKENLDEKQNKVNTLDKSLLSFKVQLGILKKGNNAEFENQSAKLKDFEKQITVTGMTRYTAGKFASYNDAVKYKNQLIAEGYSDAFVIPMFKDEIISLQEAFELQK